jgi:hypothetical protein
VNNWLKTDILVSADKLTFKTKHPFGFVLL